MIEEAADLNPAGSERDPTVEVAEAPAAEAVADPAAPPTRVKTPLLSVASAELYVIERPFPAPQVSVLAPPQGMAALGERTESEAPFESEFPQ